MERKLWRGIERGRLGGRGVGTGGMGWTRRSLGVAGVEFVAVADDDADGLREAGERTGAGSLYGDYREMLERERLDFVAVCPRWVGARTEMVIGGGRCRCQGHLLREAVCGDAGGGGRDAGGV